MNVLDNHMVSIMVHERDLRWDIHDKKRIRFHRSCRLCCFDPTEFFKVLSGNSIIVDRIRVARILVGPSPSFGNGASLESKSNPLIIFPHYNFLGKATSGRSIRLKIVTSEFAYLDRYQSPLSCVSTASIQGTR